MAVKAPSEDVAQLLHDAGIATMGASTGWGLFRAREPSGPDTAVTVYDTGGFEPDYMAGIAYPTVQVRVRGEPHGYPAAWSKVYEIRDHMLALDGVTVNGSSYNFWLQGDVAWLKFDESSRPVFVVNFRMTRSGT